MISFHGLRPLQRTKQEVLATTPAKMLHNHTRPWRGECHWHLHFLHQVGQPFVYPGAQRRLLAGHREYLPEESHQLSMSHATPALVTESTWGIWQKQGS